MADWKEKCKIMQRYDLTAEMYDERYKEEQTAKYSVALQNLDVAKRAILDVGCGSGLFFSNVTVQAKVVVGIDISRKILLKAKAQADSLVNAMILLADADHLPLRDIFFDVVFSFTVLQNMPKPSETLNELRRVTKHGGRVLVTGLKKAFPLNAFMEILESSELKLTSFIDDEDLKCYIALLTA